MCTDILYPTACDSSCDKGLTRCTGFGSDDCCNFYHNSECVDECPSPFMTNSEYVCVCPVGTTGINCEDGESLVMSLCVFPI